MHGWEVQVCFYTANRGLREESPVMSRVPGIALMHRPQAKNMFILSQESWNGRRRNLKGRL